MFAITQHNTGPTNLCRYDNTGWVNFATDRCAVACASLHVGMQHIYTMSKSSDSIAVRSYAPSGKVLTYYSGNVRAVDIIEISDTPYILVDVSDYCKHQLCSMDGFISQSFDYIHNDTVSTNTGKCYLASIWEPDRHLCDNTEGLSVVDDSYSVTSVLHASSMWTDGAVYTTMTGYRQNYRLDCFTRRDPRMRSAENIGSEYAKYNVFGRLPFGLLMGSERLQYPIVYDVRNCDAYYLDSVDPDIVKIRALHVTN